MHRAFAEMNMQLWLRYFFGNFSAEAKERWSNLCQVTAAEITVHVMYVCMPSLAGILAVHP